MNALRLRTAKAAAGLGLQVLRSRRLPLRPFKVTWMVTERCDCRCQACFIWKKAPKAREIAPADLGRMLKRSPWVRWLNLTGGEIFLRDDVPALCAAAVSARPDLAVLDFPTTGQQPEKISSDVAAIAALGIPRLYVTVSLEGPPELHDRLRGRPGAFDRALETFRRLRALRGVRVVFGTTLSDQNAQRASEMVGVLRQRIPGFSWRELHFNVYAVSAHYYGNATGPLRAPVAVDGVLSAARRARESSLDPADRIEAQWLRHLPQHLRTGRSPVPCQALRASLFIDARGDVHPCTIYGRVLGNVHQGSLDEILDAEETARARAVVRRDACPGCFSPCEAFPTLVARAADRLLGPPRA